MIALRQATLEDIAMLWDLRTRAVAALVIAGLVLLTAPLVVVPVVRFLTGLVL